MSDVKEENERAQQEKAYEPWGLQILQYDQNCLCCNRWGFVQDHLCDSCYESSYTNQMSSVFQMYHDCVLFII